MELLHLYSPGKQLKNLADTCELLQSICVDLIQRILYQAAVMFYTLWAMNDHDLGEIYNMVCLFCALTMITCCRLGNWDANLVFAK